MEQEHTNNDQNDSSDEDTNEHLEDQIEFIHTPIDDSESENESMGDGWSQENVEQDKIRSFLLLFIPILNIKGKFCNFVLDDEECRATSTIQEMYQ